MRTKLKTVLFLASVGLMVCNARVLAHTDVTPEQAHDLIDSTEDLVVVDVREPSEYCDAVGHILGALNYPLNSGVLQARYEELPIDRPILVVCRSGARSNQAANFLDSVGFPEVYDMTGGMTSWLWETAPCKYAGGSGTPDDPYQIATATDLIALGETSEDYDKHFILTADLDLDPNLPGRRVFERAVIAPDVNDVKDRFQGTPFRGTLGGDGHTISHLTIIGGGYLGLFGQLDSSAIVSDLGLEAVDVWGGASFVGGLAGLSGFGTTIIRCHSIGIVRGDNFVGGFTGANNYGRIMHCHSSGTVSGVRNVGGLVGENDEGTITTSYSTGSVAATKCVGGLVGTNWGSITTSYSTGAVSGTDDVGGLLGSNGMCRIVTECYSAGIVTGVERVGGLVGYSHGTIIAGFWDIEVSGQVNSAGGMGLTTTEMQDPATFLTHGWDSADEVLNGTSDYWQVASGDYPRLRYQSGATPAMPQGSGTAGDPYLICDSRDLGTVWFAPWAHYRLDASLDLSGIRWSVAVVPWFNGTFDGNGSVISHLEIEGGEFLGLFGCLGGEAGVSGLGVEAAEISGVGGRLASLAGRNDGRIVACYSSGMITGEGQGTHVSGLAGLNKGSITDCHSTCTVSGYDYVGGLVGGNMGQLTGSCSGGVVAGRDQVGGLTGSSHKGRISFCHNTGMVTGNNWVGGLAGTTSLGDMVSESYNVGTVSGHAAVGGLVGGNDGDISASYSAGTITGESGAGGLVGQNRGNIANCYTMGSVTAAVAAGLAGGHGYASITHSYSAARVTGQDYGRGLVGKWSSGEIASCFWDEEVSGQWMSAGGVRLTTAEMQTAATFLEAGWDFVGEAENGTEDIWWIDEGQDYPRLWWEGADAEFLVFRVEF